jgi:hypothetical protein
MALPESGPEAPTPAITGAKSVAQATIDKAASRPTAAVRHTKLSPTISLRRMRDVVADYAPRSPKNTVKWVQRSTSRRPVPEPLYVQVDE